MLFITLLGFFFPGEQFYLQECIPHTPVNRNPITNINTNIVPLRYLKFNKNYLSLFKLNNKEYYFYKNIVHRNCPTQFTIHGNNFVGNLIGAYVKLALISVK